MILSRSLTSALALVASLLSSLPATAEMTLDPGTSVTFHHHDLLGSPVMVSDHKGRVLWYENTKPYGESLGKKSSSGLGHLDNTVKEATSNLGYTGHTVDSSTGLVYMKARHYDPVVGRFYSNDPVGFTASNPMMFNRYAYVNNNPYLYVDPDGRNGVTAVGGLISETIEGITGYGDGEANYENILGAAADGYNGDGSGIGKALLDDALTFGGAGAVLGSISKLSKLAKRFFSSKPKKKARTEPNDLQEKLAMDEAKSGSGDPFMNDKVTDPKYKDTHDKMRHNHDHGDGTRTEIHYWKDRDSGQTSGHKFKDAPDNQSSRSTRYP